MFTMRNLGGVALFLFGTTFLWLTTSFATKGVRTSGTAWSATNVLALLTLAGFTAATWGLFRASGWWEAVAVASAAVGCMAVVPYWIAARDAGEVSPGWNVFVHLIGSAGVFVLLLVPSLERWVSEQVGRGGRG
jgi:hypothetical protein